MPGRVVAQRSPCAWGCYKISRPQSLYQGLDGAATMLVKLIEPRHLVHISVGVFHAEPPIRQEPNVLALLHTEFRRAAIGLHGPLLVAEANVYGFDVRDARNEHGARKVALDQL